MQTALANKFDPAVETNFPGADPCKVEEKKLIVSDNHREAGFEIPPILYLGVVVFLSVLYTESLWLSYNLLSREIFIFGIPIHATSELNHLDSIQVWNLVRTLSLAFKTLLMTIFILLFRISTPDFQAIIRTRAAGTLLISGTIIISYGLSTLIDYITIQTTIPPEAVFESPVVIFLLRYVLSSVFLGPIVEETIFRLLIFKAMRNKGHGLLLSMIISSALFALFHLPTTTVSLFQCFLIGLLWSAAYERTGSLLTPILIHAGFNALINVDLLSHWQPDGIMF